MIVKKALAPAEGICTILNGRIKFTIFDYLTHPSVTILIHGYQWGGGGGGFAEEATSLPP